VTCRAGQACPVGMGQSPIRHHPNTIPTLSGSSSSTRKRGPRRKCASAIDGSPALPSTQFGTPCLRPSMETKHSSLPAYLPTLAREIDAALVRGGKERLPGTASGGRQPLIPASQPRRPKPQSSLKPPMLDLAVVTVAWTGGGSRLAKWLSVTPTHSRPRAGDRGPRNAETG
jgi:hypothetical protein